MDKPSLSPAEEVYDFLLSAPTPEAVITFRPSQATQARIHELLEANREGELSAEEQAELDEFSRIEHFVRMLKARARVKLASS
jgi:hypothetical protein